ncbi:site-specific DNA-methyltransferase [Bacillus subtilis]|nr:site-specific DNA-methyltransferase [Bacillus subtilis]
MQKLEGKTFNVVQDNIEKLKELFPEVFTENKVDIDKLRLALGENVEKEKERYEFTWNGKAEAIRLAQKLTTGTLLPCIEESVDWEKTNNLYFEGDNLEVLRIIQNSYRSKVKMIYIDPPYNTGKDFVYKDNYHDNVKNYKKLTQENMKSNPETNGRFHTDWLNMMYPRLKLARNLLKDDGVIFISIDDTEVDNLKKICDEIFGEDNFIGMFIVNSSPSAIDYGHMGKTNEYVLFYAKNINYTDTFHLPDEEKQFKYRDDKGEFNIYPLYNGNVAFNPQTRPNLFYPFYLNPNNKIDEDFYEIGLEKKKDWIEVYPVISKKDGIQRVWRWGKKKASEGLNDEIVGYKTDSGEYRVVQKTRLTGKVIRSLQLDTEISSRKGTGEVESLFGRKIFSFPKPIELIRRFAAISTSEEDLILDFFSGSSSTAHAILKLNSEDNGKRKFIMIQLPEITDEKSEAFKAGYKNICEIGKERIRKAGKKIIDELKDDKTRRDLDIGFKVFKLDETNLKMWDEESIDLENTLLDIVEPIKEGRTQFDVVYEILLKYGIDITVPIEELIIANKAVYSVGMGYLLICLERDLSLEQIEEMAKQQPARIVFYDEGFKDDTVRTNAQQILKRYGIEDIRVI